MEKLLIEGLLWIYAIICACCYFHMAINIIKEQLEGAE